MKLLILVVALALIGCEKDSDGGSGPSTEQTYIGNRNTHVLHMPDCPYLPNEENRLYFDNCEDADGFDPHDYCHPCQ